VLQIGAGDLAAAADTAATCAAAEVPAWAASLPAALASGIRARIALAHGQAERALDALEGIALGPWIHLAHEVPQCGLVAERRSRAEAHRALGQNDAGEAWQTPPATLRPFEWALLQGR